MASSYALPVSAMTHSHGHNHIHSHSLSPGGHQSSTSRNLKAQRSNGNLHVHSHSESHFEQYANSPPRERHSYLPSPPNSSSLAAPPTFESRLLESPIPEVAPPAYEPLVNAVNVLPQDHKHHEHSHRHAPSLGPQSKFTSILLPLVLQWPLLYTILAEKDSRRIFYFMSLNFAFMLVQAAYGYITDSLGLLSDSIHMFFDCLALGVGLYASLASKWPPSERFPYGFGKIESLSGFGNGVFLMLISIEILIEAVERLANGRETTRLGELFTVSTLGFVVNMVGMACFGHHHHGHDHGGHSHGLSDSLDNHSHGHSHTPSHSHSHSHLHSHSHSADHHDHDHHDHDHASHSSLLVDSSSTKHSHADHSHSHNHDNENMHGIFLHVLADTMGSAAVIASTILIYFTGWNGWDPLASIIIAVLIFIASIPLIKSCAKKLLLTIPDAVEYNLRDTLTGVSELRGVASYTVPRFWLGDKNTDSESESVLGIIHIIAHRGSDLDDVRERARNFMLGRGMDVVVQVESSDEARIGTSCWCSGSVSGGGSGSSAALRSPALY